MKAISSLMTRICALCALIPLLFVSGFGQNTQPSPRMVFDLKEYGFAIRNDVLNETSIGFLNDQLIAAYLYKCVKPGSCSSTVLLLINLNDKEVTPAKEQFSGKLAFLSDGRILLVTSDGITVYGSQLKPLVNKKLFTDPSSLQIKDILVSPNGKRFSIPSGEGSLIFNAADLSIIAQPKILSSPSAITNGLSNHLPPMFLSRRTCAMEHWSRSGG